MIIHAIKYVNSSGIIPVERHKKTVRILTNVGSMSYVSPMLPHTPKILLSLFVRYSFFILSLLIYHKQRRSRRPLSSILFPVGRLTEAVFRMISRQYYSTAGIFVIFRGHIG